MRERLQIVLDAMVPQPVAAAILTVSMKSFGFAGAPVLGALELSVGPYETLALTGPSGIGKSTLLCIIAGLEPRFVGLRLAPPRIALVFQEPTLLTWRNAAQKLCLSSGISTAKAHDWLKKVGLGGLGDRFPAQLSLGQQRRLALARAFAAAPDLLLMDEPFVSQDEGLRQDMIEVFTTLRAAQPLATILVTHDEFEASLLATRILRLSGTPAQIVESRENTDA